MNVNSVEELNNMFRAGRMTNTPEEIVVRGVHYRRHDAVMHAPWKMVENNYKCFVVYSVQPREKRSDAYQRLKEQGVLNEWIVFIWGITRSMVIAPARVATNTAARAKTDLNDAEHNLAEGSNGNIIHDETQITFHQFQKTLPAKVDTGANMSSLHVEGWQKAGDQVEFRSKMLSDNIIRAPLVNQVSVKTSEGTEIRPVVELDISLEGHQVAGAQFNLNDRSHMNDAILIGQNILEKGNFLVDPNGIKDTMEATVDWDALQELYEDVQVEDTLTEEQVEEMYELLLNSNVSFSDIMRRMKTIAIQTIEETNKIY